jgi:hypothetical protein
MTDHHDQPPTRTRHRLAAVAGALLAATGAVLLAAGPAAAAPAAPAVDTCTDWVDVPYADVNDGFVNDRHGRVGTQVRTCTSDSGPATAQARATYTQLGPDTWGRQQEGITLRIFDLAGGCYGCDTIWRTGPLPEPPVGGVFFGPEVVVTPDHPYGTDVSIDYVDPPNPFWFQTGTVEWTSPTPEV